MPRPPGLVSEKSKDFKGSMKRLIKSLNKWKYSLIIALVFAFVSAILGLITPNRLSNLTDEISLGLQPNINEKSVSEIMQDPKISMDSKIKFNEFLETANENSLSDMDKLPSDVYEVIKPRMNMDKIKTISILLCILVVGMAILNYLQSLILTVISNKYAKRLRSKISSKINK